MIERHHDYQLTIASLPTGGLKGVTLQLDSDAPFALRLTKTRNMPSTGYRFRNPRGVYADSAEQVELSARGTVRYPQMVYPANGNLVIDVPNAGAPVTNVRVLFRGSKLYQDGAIAAPTYPDKCSTLPFIYPVVVQGVLALTKGRNNNVQLQIASDADFALRYCYADSFKLVTGSPYSGSGAYTELYVTLRDSEYKAYSNEPIHIDDLFGGKFAILGPLTDSAQATLWPGLFTPEIYIPRSGSLFFDIFRNDTVTTSTSELHFRFCGAKVFHR